MSENIAKAELAELRKDKAIVDYLCDRCYFPNEAPKSGFSLCAGVDVIPLGHVTLNFEKDRKTIRAALNAARASQQPKEDGK